MKMEHPYDSLCSCESCEYHDPLNSIKRFVKGIDGDTIRFLLTPRVPKFIARRILKLLDVVESLTK
jgi:hypothetical protein